ncbi:DNA-processing protein DprA [Streptomyces alkaliterrae]|uniref:DNA-protecting protein DprA n=2 Tax=Streptomyces alkaliterrae TaxID=2213162 RepID=A0A7W3WRQ6_9ACTN|nr:DNA-processing protein DprA [Streptomyces alkaliterrae]MBB1257241.1 DNA-protecting protein DprA [Streptomyces alkaliterrae]
MTAEPEPEPEPQPEPQPQPEPEPEPQPEPEWDPGGREAAGGTPEAADAPPADAERLARAALGTAVEPGDELVGALIDTHGLLGLWDALRGGTPPDRVPVERWERLRTRLASAEPERDLAASAALGGRFLCPGDREWPGQLDDLGPARPLGLWVRGRCSLRLAALRSVAVVGARACTEYGAWAAARLAGGLAERGWSVVSGAAYGVDGAAHRGALAAGGLTIGVLACGVDRPYPRAHRALIERVAEEGLLLAELPPGAHPTRSRFLQRNRLIAALARGTVVVEARLRSGALVTARRATALGRHVMGVPGPVSSPLSGGVHRLLREEGVLVTDADEVIELVGEMGDLAPREEGPVLPRDLLHPRTREVLELLPAHAAVTSGQVSDRAGAPEPEVRARLLELSSLGFVLRRGGYWQLGHPSG